MTVPLNCHDSNSFHPTQTIFLLWNAPFLTANIEASSFQFFSQLLFTHSAPGAMQQENSLDFYFLTSTDRLHRSSLLATEFIHSVLSNSQTIRTQGSCWYGVEPIPVACALAFSSDSQFLLIWYFYVFLLISKLNKLKTIKKEISIKTEFQNSKTKLSKNEEQLETVPNCWTSRHWQFFFIILSWRSSLHQSAILFHASVFR